MTKYFDFDLKENYGIQICTSGTRPTAYEGRHIYETDTNKTLVCTNVTGPVWEEISGGGVSVHSSLSNLAWSVAGHSIDADISPTTNQTIHLGSASNAFNTIFVDSLSNFTTDAQIECLKNFDMNAHDIYDVDGLYLNSGATMYLKEDATGNMELHVATGKKVEIIVG